MTATLKSAIKSTDLAAPRTAVAFEGTDLIAQGPLSDVALAARRATAKRGARAREILVLDAVTSEPIELDLRGSERALLARLTDDAVPHGADGEPRGPGRPRLGVIGREVTLLPRHWDWLAAQPGGASAAIRRLVDKARVENAAKDRVRIAQERCYRFLIATLGGAHDFEEATRALFALDRVKFLVHSEHWPRDARDHARKLAEAVFDAAG
jgi:hypothetical protein